MSLRQLFVLLNFGCLAVFIAAVVVDDRAEWKPYQSAYYEKTAQDLEQKLAAAGDPAEKKELEGQIRKWRHHPLEIKQIIAKDLDRVDRCVTCHVGMDEFTNPTLVNDFKENPYKGHPDVSGLLAKHPLQKFGCTVCHRGQGLATTMAAAHNGIVTTVGTAKLQDDAMLPPPFIQASCARCHADFEKLHGAETAALGRKLFEQNGCIGCHSINGSGGIISVDLGDIADKPTERISPHDFMQAKLPQAYDKISVKNWILAHLNRDPMSFVQNDPEGKYNAEPIAPSGMPPFYLEWKSKDGEFSKESVALATYLLSLSHEEIPHRYYVYAPAAPEPKFKSAEEHGKFVFKKYGCAACHGIEAAGGRRIFNGLGPGQDLSGEPVAEMAKGREPNLRDTAGTYTREELVKKIQDGVPVTSIKRFKDDGPVPPAFMPSWKEKIKGQELEDLVTYLLSIAKKNEGGF